MASFKQKQQLSISPRSNCGGDHFPAAQQQQQQQHAPSPRANHHCLCSPTTHPGSFRCRIHRQQSNPGSPTSASWPKPHKFSATDAATGAASVSPEPVESA